MRKRSGVIFSMISFRPLEIPADPRRLLNLLVEAGGVYAPEIIGDHERYRHGDVPQLERNWIEEGSFAGFLFKRKRPIEVNIVLTFVSEDLRRQGPHDIFVSIDGAYFDSMKRLAELVDLGNTVYDLLLPCYGFIELPWMPTLKASTIPDRGFPGWGWATWLGPEYDTIIRFPPLVDVNVNSTSDGGRLIQLPYPESFAAPDPQCMEAHAEICHYIDDRVFQTPITGDSVDPHSMSLSSDERTNGATGQDVPKREVLLPKFRFRDL